MLIIWLQCQNESAENLLRVGLHKSGDVGKKKRKKTKENEKCTKKTNGVYSCVLGKQEPLLVFSEKEAQEYDL